MSSPAATTNPAIDRVINATTPGMSPKEAAVYAADIVTRSGTSFAAGMKILSRERREATLTAIIDRIRAKIDYGEPVRPDEAEAFLRAFYNAQRAHLEQRQLFGDKRADKHHAEAE